MRVSSCPSLQHGVLGLPARGSWECNIIGGKEIFQGLLGELLPLKTLHAGYKLPQAPAVGSVLQLCVYNIVWSLHQ